MPFLAVDGDDKEEEEEVEDVVLEVPFVEG